MAIKPPTGFGPKDATQQASSRFTDREPESKALSRSLETHRRALNEDLIDGEVMNNMLVFWGIGGVGKSTLSKCLEDWINGRTDECSHWGPPPTGLGVVTTRWDMRDRQMLKSPVLFYLKLRQKLREVGIRTAMFDIGIVALASKYNSAEGTGDRGRGLEALPEIAEQAIAETFPHAPMPDETQAVSRAERRLLNLVSEKGAVAKAVGAAQDLSDTVARILSGEADVRQLEIAVAGVGWLLTLDLDRIDGPKRPLPVVFLDTFEALESDRQARDEHVINSAVAALPLCLFVVTGRHRVDWAGCRHDLAVWGTTRWPSLARTCEGQEEPRQHLVGVLDVKDARELLEYYLATVGSPLEEGLAAKLAETTQLPIHIDAIVELARDFVRRSPGHTLTHQDLAGDLRVIVERIMERFTPEEARLLQAAAVAGNFDAPMLAAMAQTTVGWAQRFLDNALVQRVVGQHAFEFHLHDEVKRLVLEAGHGVTHAWSEEDRTSAAERGLAYLEGELERTRREDLLERRLMLHAAAFHLAMRYGLEPKWVVTEFKKTPSRIRLSRLVTVAPDAVGILADTARLNAKIALGPKARLVALRKWLPSATEPSIWRQGRLWYAYALRNLDRDEEALGIIQDLRESHPAKVYRTQEVATLRMLRRYKDAVTAWLRHGDRAGLSLGPALYGHGLLEQAVIVAEARHDSIVEEGGARRFVADLRNTVVNYRFWLGRATDAEIDEVFRLAEMLDRPTGIQSYWRWTAVRHLFDDDRVAVAWRELWAVRNHDGDLPTAAKRALLIVAGLRMLAVGDARYLEEVRSRLDLTAYYSCIAAEFLWEHLCDLGLVDAPLGTREAQWIDDREVVKQRWIAIFYRLIDEARQRCGVSAEQEG